jgi:hypothetical protein
MSNYLILLFFEINIIRYKFSNYFTFLVKFAGIKNLKISSYFYITIF